MIEVFKTSRASLVWFLNACFPVRLLTLQYSRLIIIVIINMIITTICNAWFLVTAARSELRAHFKQGEFCDFYDCPMALRSEYGSKKKMAEGGNEAELLKEKANNYFKGRFGRPVKSTAFNRCSQLTKMAASPFVAT